MGIWKDKLTRGWVYKFEFQKKAHGARGFKTRREAEAARVKRREEVREQSVAEIKTATDGRHRNERGHGMKSATPCNHLVGGTGIEPVTSTV